MIESFLLVTLAAIAPAEEPASDAAWNVNAHAGVGLAAELLARLQRSHEEQRDT